MSGPAHDCLDAVDGALDAGTIQDAIRELSEVNGLRVRIRNASCHGKPDVGPLMWIPSADTLATLNRVLEERFTARVDSALEYLRRQS